MCFRCLPAFAGLRVRRASDERRRVPASITFVSVEKETSARGRLVGSARAVHRRSRLRVFAFLLWFISLLVVVLWCVWVGNPDLWDRGLVCFWGTFLSWLVCPQLALRLGTGSCPNHFPTRLRPSTAVVSIVSVPATASGCVPIGIITPTALTCPTCFEVLVVEVR